MSTTNSSGRRDDVTDRMSVPFDVVNQKIYYPILPDDTDFETYRKTDPAFKEILENEGPLSSRSGILDDEKVDSEEKRERTRCIVQMWPRDPNGEVLRETPYREGKTTGNGLPLWGATLYDFYLR